MRNNYAMTMVSCFVGYVAQAIVNNFVPLLFVMFQSNYGFSMSEITTLIAFNFIVQLITDIVSAGFVDKIGYRISICIAHLFCAAGLVLLTILPDVLGYGGLLMAVVLYAIGGGLIEVLISPIMEACPSENKEKAMSLLHSFYCWGHMGVVLLSTLFFAVLGIGNWKILSVFWALIPFANMFLFALIPIGSMQPADGEGKSLKELFSLKLFWAFMIMMLCAGASEQAVSQWASTFAEEGLGVSKTIGDLAGPMAFAFLMGTARLIYGKCGDRINLNGFMVLSAGLCIISYLCISLIPVPLIGLLGCAICGFSVGIMWPGTISKAAFAIRGGGTAMFAMFAVAGDIGCTAGPSLAGFVTDLSGKIGTGILSAIIFPVIMFALLLVLMKKRRA